MSNRGTVKIELLKAFLALIVGIALAIFTYYSGKSKGADEQKTAFDQIATELNLDKTKWQVSYEDVALTKPDPSGPPPPKRREPNKPTTTETPPLTTKVATLEFTQKGSRILGEGRDMSGRRWIVEGAASKRRVCYIYIDPGGDRLSMGAVLLEQDNSGQMAGQWLGWSPESNALSPRRVTLKKIN